MALTKVFDDCLFALGAEHTERERARGTRWTERARERETLSM